MPNRYKLYALPLDENELFRPEIIETVKGNPNMIYVGNDRYSNYRIYCDENGILFAGEYLPTIPVKTDLSSAEISDSLQEISRKGLTDAVQAYFMGQADKKPNEKSEEQL